MMNAQGKNGLTFLEAYMRKQTLEALRAYASSWLAREEFRGAALDELQKRG